MYYQVLHVRKQTTKTHAISAIKLVQLSEEHLIYIFMINYIFLIYFLLEFKVEHMAVSEWQRLKLYKLFKLK